MRTVTEALVAAASGVTNSFSRSQVGQKENLRCITLRAENERLRSIVISVVRFVVRFIDSLYVLSRKSR